MYELIGAYIFFVISLLLIVFLFAKIVETINLLAKRKNIDESMRFMKEKYNELSEIVERLNNKKEDIK